MKKIIFSFLVLASVCFADGLVTIIDPSTGEQKKQLQVGVPQDLTATSINVGGTDIVPLVLIGSNTVQTRVNERAEVMDLNKKIHILLMGQSNAEGAPERQTPLMPINYSYNTYATFLNGVSNAWFQFFQGTSTVSKITGNVKQYETKEWGVEIPIAHYWTKYARSKVYITKVAKGGTQLCNSLISTPTDPDTWAPDQAGGNNIFSNILPSVLSTRSVYPVSSNVDVVVWMQGESDCNNSTEANLYYSNFTNFQAKVRLALTNPTLPWVVCGLNTNYMGTANTDAVRDALRLAAVTDPYTTYIESFDLPLISNVSAHFTAEGYWMYGKRIVGGIRGVLSKQATIDGGLDVKGTMNARHGYFNQELYGADIKGNTAEIDTIADQYGTLSTLAIRNEGLQLYFDVMSTNIVDLTGKQTPTIIGTNQTWTLATNALSRGYAFRGAISNDISTVGAGSALNFTISFWMRVYGSDSSGFVGDILSSTGSHLDYLSIIPQVHNARCSMRIGSETNSAQVFNPEGYWCHFVYTYQHTLGAVAQENKMYINGQLCNVYATTRFGFTGLFTFGGPVTGTIDTDVYIDDMTLWNRAITPEEVRVMYNAQSRGLTGVRGL